MQSSVTESRAFATKSSPTSLKRRDKLLTYSKLQQKTKLQREKMIDCFPFTLSMMIWRTRKIDNTEKVYYCQTYHLFSRLYIPQKQQENWDFIHSPVFHKPRV